MRENSCRQKGMMSMNMTMMAIQKSAENPRDQET
jgi:hypothetical protein